LYGVIIFITFATDLRNTNHLNHENRDEEDLQLIDRACDSSRVTGSHQLL
jgi:hypothetical protein